MEMIHLRKNKKGFTYLLTVMLVLALLILVFLTGNRYRYQDEARVTKVRILALNDFVANLDADIHRATYITSFRSLLSLEDYVATRGVFFNDTELVFAEVFTNGTVNGEPMGLMNDSAFVDYLAKVNELAGRIGIRSNILLQKVTLQQLDPWTVGVTVDLFVEFNDTRGVASWLINESYVTAVPIYDLRDPLYSFFTENRLPNTIRSYPVVDLVNLSDNDTTHLVAFTNGSYYRASPFAPTFLQRFENNNSANEYGIESLVNIQDISLQDLGVYPDRVKVDFMYFNDLSAVKRCNFTNVPDELYLVLPSDRLELYMVSELNYSTSCN